MPEPQSGAPEDRSDPSGTPPRRKVPPLAPTPAPPPPSKGTTAEAIGPARMPRSQRIIIEIGLAYCAFIWLSMGLALLHRQ